MSTNTDPIILSYRVEGGFLGYCSTEIYKVSCAIPESDRYVTVTVEVDGPYPWFAIPPPAWLSTQFERDSVIEQARRAVLARRTATASIVGIAPHADQSPGGRI